MSNSEIIEYDKVMERLDGDKELFHELVALFVESHIETLDLLRKAVSENVPAEVRAQAHSIKGALGNIGAVRAHAAAFALEDAGKREQSTTFNGQLQTLEKEISAFLDEYKTRKWE